MHIQKKKRLHPILKKRFLNKQYEKGNTEFNTSKDN